MKRLTGYVLLLTLVSPPAHALLPIAGMAKDIVKNIVQSFVEAGYNSIASSTGPCGMAMAPPGAAALANVKQGMAAARNPSLGAAAGAMPGTGLGQDMSEARMKEAMARMPGGQAAGGLGAGGMPRMTPEMMAAMKDQTPLSSAEAEELGTIMERMSAAAPSMATKCKPGEMKQTIQMTADTPGAGGMMRMMLGRMREAQKQIDGARATFAKMSEPERNESIAAMTDQFRGWGPENRKAFLGMIETNFLGMPETMRTQLLARLKRVD